MFCRLIAQEFDNAFCWNSITIPCYPKLYKAKTTQFDCAVLVAQNCQILYRHIVLCFVDTHLLFLYFAIRLYFLYLKFWLLYFFYT
jgi:hypothetical protein